MRTHWQNVPPAQGFLGDGVEISERIVVFEAGDGHSAHFVNLFLGFGQDFGVLEEAEDTGCDGSDSLMVNWR